MRWVTLLAAAILVGVGAAFAFTGWNREAAPVLLLTGILLAVASRRPSAPPRRGR